MRELLLTKSNPRITVLFLRGLGLVYFFQWLNLSFQLPNLFSSQGVLPLEEILTQATGYSDWMSAPSIFWFHSSDIFLYLAGATISFLGLWMAFGKVERWILIVCWALQLSFSVLSYGIFIHIWDRLLLEVGFLSIFLVKKEGDEILTSRPIKFLLNLVLFRLLVHSGLEKYLPSSDESWVDLTYMKNFWFTQLTPTLVSWGMYQLPMFFHKVFSYLTFFAEIVLPPLVFAPLFLRRLLFLIFVIFQIGIFVTGNFEIFNILASFLALLLIDDRSIRWLWKVTTVLPQRQTVNGKWYFWLQFFGIEKVAVGVFVLLLPAHILHLSYAFDKGHGLVSDQWVDYYYQDSQSKGAPVQVLAGYLKWISRFHLVNEYGVFGGHPLARYRFAFESSDDAQSWHSLNIGGDLLDEKRPPLFSFIFHERFNTNLWLMGQGLEFVRLQKHHDLYSQIPSMGELICHWLKKKSPTSMALRIRAESCKFLDIGEFRWKNGNWWSCQPAGEEYVCH